MKMSVPATATRNLVAILTDPNDELSGSLAASADGPALAVSDDWGPPAPRDLSSLPQPSSGVVATHRSDRSAPASIAAAPAARTRRIGRSGHLVRLQRGHGPYAQWSAAAVMPAVLASRRAARPADGRN